MVDILPISDKQSKFPRQPLKNYEQYHNNSAFLNLLVKKDKLTQQVENDKNYIANYNLLYQYINPIDVPQKTVTNFQTIQNNFLQQPDWLLYNDNILKKSNSNFEKTATKYESSIEETNKLLNFNYENNSEQTPQYFNSDQCIFNINGITQYDKSKLNKENCAQYITEYNNNKALYLEHLSTDFENNFSNQVINYIEYTDMTDSSIITFQLHPEELGELSIYIKFNENSGNNIAKIFSPSQQIVNILQGQSDCLLESFQNIGITMDKLEFTTKDTDNETSFGSYKRKYNIFPATQRKPKTLDIFI